MQMEPPPPGSLPSFHLYPTQVNAASLTFHQTVAALDKRAGPLLQVPRALLIAQKGGGLCLSPAQEVSMGVNTAFSG